MRYIWVPKEAEALNRLDSRKVLVIKYQRFLSRRLYQCPLGCGKLPMPRDDLLVHIQLAHYDTPALDFGSLSLDATAVTPSIKESALRIESELRLLVCLAQRRLMVRRNLPYHVKHCKHCEKTIDVELVLHDEQLKREVGNKEKRLQLLTAYAHACEIVCAPYGSQVIKLASRCDICASMMAAAGREYILNNYMCCIFKVGESDDTVHCPVRADNPWNTMLLNECCEAMEVDFMLVDRLGNEIPVVHAAPKVKKRKRKDTEERVNDSKINEGNVADGKSNEPEDSELPDAPEDLELPGAPEDSELSDEPEEPESVDGPEDLELSDGPEQSPLPMDEPELSRLPMNESEQANLPDESEQVKLPAPGQAKMPDEPEKSALPVDAPEQSPLADAREHSESVDAPEDSTLPDAPKQTELPDEAEGPLLPTDAPEVKKLPMHESEGSELPAEPEQSELPDEPETPLPDTLKQSPDVLEDSPLPDALEQSELVDAPEESTSPDEAEYSEYSDEAEESEYSDEAEESDIPVQSSQDDSPSDTPVHSESLSVDTPTSLNEDERCSECIDRAIICKKRAPGRSCEECWQRHRRCTFSNRSLVTPPSQSPSLPPPPPPQAAVADNVAAEKPIQESKPPAKIDMRQFVESIADHFTKATFDLHTIVANRYAQRHIYDETTSEQNYSFVTDYRNPFNQGLTTVDSAVIVDMCQRLSAASKKQAQTAAFAANYRDAYLLILQDYEDLEKHDIRLLKDMSVALDDLTGMVYTLVYICSRTGALQPFQQQRFNFGDMLYINGPYMARHAVVKHNRMHLVDPHVSVELPWVVSEMLIRYLVIARPLQFIIAKRLGLGDRMDRCKGGFMWDTDYSEGKRMPRLMTKYLAAATGVPVRPNDIKTWHKNCDGMSTEQWERQELKFDQEWEQWVFEAWCGGESILER